MWRDRAGQVRGRAMFVSLTENISIQPEPGPGITDIYYLVPSHFRAFSFQTFQSIKLSSEKSDVTQMMFERKLIFLIL